jgi:GntR family transcriptional regulator
MNQVAALPISISGEDAMPIYHQLARAIQEQIENGRLAVGEQIPPERKIAALGNVSLATVRKALETLVQRGLLTRVQGKGTYVSSTAIRRKKIRYYPFVDDFYGNVADADIKLIEFNIINGDNRINRHLKIKTTEDLYEMKRLFVWRGKPLIHSISYLPRKMFKNLNDYHKSHFEKNLLYMLLEEEFGIPTVNNIELYGAALADEDNAKLLQVEVGHPLLTVEMIALTYKEKPYEYRMTYFLSDEKKLRRII